MVTEVYMRHESLLSGSSVADACLSTAKTCFHLIDDACHDQLDTDPANATVIADLGARAVTSAQAAVLLAGHGFWVPAIHQLRDMGETGQLIEYFRHHPQDIDVWLNSPGKVRFEKFGFGLLAKRLGKLRGEEANWRTWFEECSNSGSHVSVEGLAIMQIGDSRKQIRAIFEPGRFKRLIYTIGFCSICVTLAFVETLDSILPSERAMERRFRDRCAEFVRWRSFYADFDLERAVANWNPSEPTPPAAVAA
jgi:hypothetical protein